MSQHRFIAPDPGIAAGRSGHLRRERLLLVTACRDHSDGFTRADVTVQTCWDADRLDLGRVGMRPDPGRLCTEAAREPGGIEDAYQRSRFHHEA